MSPGAAFLERTVDVTISGFGTEWSDGVTADFGPGITVSDVHVASPTALQVTLDVTEATDLGVRDVIVSQGGTDLTYAGGFAVEAPLFVNGLFGTQAQGSIVAAQAEQLDSTTPFGEFAALGAPTGVADTVSPFAISGLLFLDVNAPVGATDVVAQSFQQGEVVTSRAPGAVSVAPRTPTVITAGQVEQGTFSAEFETLLYQIDVPADTQLTLDVAVNGKKISLPPTAVLVPGSGVVSDLVDTAPTQVATGGAAETFYVIVWNDSGLPDLSFDIETSTIGVAIEVEPNDVFDKGQAVVPPVAVAAEIGVIGDQDWYAVPLAAGETLTATVGDGVADQCGPFGYMDTEIEIMDVDGVTSLDFNDDIDFTNYCSEGIIVAPAAGTYFVRVSTSTLFCAKCVGTYSLTLTVEPAPAP